MEFVMVSPEGINRRGTEYLRSLLTEENDDEGDNAEEDNEEEEEEEEDVDDLINGQEVEEALRKIKKRITNQLNVMIYQ